MPHERLSDKLRELLQANTGGETYTLNDVMARTGGKGIYSVMVLLCLPFISPIPLPLLSTVFGAVIIGLAVRQFLGLPARLPGFLGRYQIVPERHQRVLEGSLKFVKTLEKVVRPRGVWMQYRVAALVHALILIFMGLLLMLPFPPFIPFTNSLPGYAVIVIAVCLMEEDGLLIWLGYALAVLSATYILLIYGSAVAVFQRYYQSVIQFFESLL